MFSPPGDGLVRGCACERARVCKRERRREITEGRTHGARGRGSR